ncbi:hypothetical protein BDW02DRAFT_572951 [Decorospora gaudefroyi]|uniref:HAD-like protein n=1 Tax=Decorospora gaudefroyi TaxID=184978 RepID=A0A6A5K7F2_9PLEO|nr:hypothetical protein BDW02DRAFT_572951 [Decorospora gaudefroyi]
MPTPLLRTPQKRNLLLCLDAFNTLFHPRTPIPQAYAQAATRHGIPTPHPQEVAQSFKQNFAHQSTQHPNYGKATGMGLEKWWSQIIRNIFTPYLKRGQVFPEALTEELLRTWSSKEGYALYADVEPFFRRLRRVGVGSGADLQGLPWHRTVVGVITNSDARVPSILSSFGLSVGPRTNEDGAAEFREGSDISFVVLSYDVGFEKPHPQIFEAAVEMLRKELQGNEQGLTIDDFEKLYVGDDLEKDYFGAEKAGWGSVLLRREDGDKKGLGREQIKGKEVTVATSLLDLGG